jgi:hypothetical protein
MTSKLYHRLFFKFVDCGCQLFYFNAKVTLLRKMSKNVSQSATLGKQNRTKMKGKSKFPPGIVKFQVLGSGANGAPRCLYLFTDHSR